MNVLLCLAVEHDLRLVALAAFAVTTGGWVALGLVRRASERSGTMRAGWTGLAAIAAGASIWCTHFIAMLAYNVRAPITFDTNLTALSLVISVGGAGAAICIAINQRTSFMVLAGGALLGATIAAMHYVGMLGYRVDGLVDWDIVYVLASLVVGIGLGSLAMFHAISAPSVHSSKFALALFVAAVVGMHFTGMTAYTVTPMLTGAPLADQASHTAMAIAIAGISSIIALTGIISFVIDTTATKEMVQRLQQMATSDALTGLPNRVSFAEHIDAEIAVAHAKGGQLAVIGIDLDRFKDINDLHGHGAGDTVLKTLADRLSGLLREGEFTARIGGDEFAAAKRFSHKSELTGFLDRLKEALFLPVSFEGGEAITGASLGISVFPGDGDTGARLVSNADLAMYRAKSDVTRVVCFYEPKMDEAARYRNALGVEMRKAIELNQFELHYQVQANVASGQISGYEVLLRWHHPERGMVSPADFIPVAEETGAILAIDEWVLRTACREAASWPIPHKIAVNLSAVQVTQLDLPRKVHEILLESGLSAGRLELELTETSIITDKDRTLHVLRQIKALGVAIAMDDFGTGYSSLSTLRSFPFDKIKLDRSFMGEVEHDPQAKAVVRAVLSLGKSLHVPVLAEGVETAEQLTILREEGCDEAQGYLLGRPRPVAQICLTAEANDDSRLFPENGVVNRSPGLRRAAG
jgi:diguanylate cyclase (GGDEF)-like protein